VPADSDVAVGRWRLPLASDSEVGRRGVAHPQANAYKKARPCSLFLKRMKGLEPSTFCMASSHFRTDLPRLLKNTSVYRASEGG
jgi:hypothetical protein